MLVVAVHIPVKQTLVELLATIAGKQQCARQIAVAEQRGNGIAAPAAQFVDEFEVIHNITLSRLYPLRGGRAVKHR